MTVLSSKYNNDHPENGLTSNCQHQRQKALPSTWKANVNKYNDFDRSEISLQSNSKRTKRIF